MDAEPTSEGSYDAPLDQLPSPSAFPESAAPQVTAADRQARIDRVRQRRAEMAQNPSSLSSALTQTAAPAPLTVKDASPVAAPASTAALRSDLVQEAVDFLNNPRVASAPLATKRKFLVQRKGLTEVEVDEAVRRSNPSSSTPAAPMAVAPAPAPPAVPAPPGYYGAPTMYQMPPPPSVAYPSLKSIAFVVVVCVGLASGLMHLFKKYVWAYWFPKKREMDEKLVELESRFAKAQELMSAQANDTRDALSVLRGFLENQLTDWSERQRLETLKEENDSKAISELKREVSSVRHLIPSVGNFARSVKASSIQTDVLDEIRNEISSLKNAVKLLVSNATSGVLSSGTSLGASSRASSSNLVELGASSTPAAQNASDSSSNASTSNPASGINNTNDTSSPIAVGGSSSSAPSSSTNQSANTTSSNPSSVSSPLAASQSKRQRPAWMQQQTTSLPAWQMESSKTENNSLNVASSASAGAATNNSNNNNTTSFATTPETEEQNAIATPTAITSSPSTTTPPPSSNADASEQTSQPERLESAAPLEPASQKTNEEPPYPQSYKDILRMIQQGITPPNVKTDVDDRPRDPDAPLQDGSLKSRSKPWANAGHSAEPLSFKVSEEEDSDIPKNIGSLDSEESDGEETVLSDIESA